MQLSGGAVHRKFLITTPELILVPGHIPHTVYKSHFFKPFWSQGQGQIPGKNGVVISLESQGHGQGIPRSNSKYGKYAHTPIYYTTSAGTDKTTAPAS